MPTSYFRRLNASSYIGSTFSNAFFCIGAILFAAFFVSCSSTARSELSHISTFAGRGGGILEPFGIAGNGAETYISDGEAGKVFKLGADGAHSEFASGLHTPSGLAVGMNGHILVADTGAHTIRSIGPNGASSLIAGIENESGSTDGEASRSKFHGPVGIAAVKDGRIFVADTYNDRIRVIENGSVRTLAGGKRGFRDGVGTGAMFDTPLGIAIWKDRVLVADSGNRRVRVVEPSGEVWTIAGDGSSERRDGMVLNSSFSKPTAIAVDEKENIYVADGNAVRRIGRTVIPLVLTVAGGFRGFRNGEARNARFNRISGLAFSPNGALLITDSENQIVRKFSPKSADTQSENIERPRAVSAEEFRSFQPARWPFDPPNAKRDIAGTLGEIRGDLIDNTSQVWFHNGLDIAGNYGETARSIRTEKVLDPTAAENFATLRELIRMPTLGYIHLRLGRGKDDTPFGDPRFVFDVDDTGRLSAVRVRRGAIFNAGDPIGTLNAMNHVHLIAGRAGAEMNALAALDLPGVSDKIAPTIVSVSFFDEDWTPLETKTKTGRIIIGERTRIIVSAFDRMDGNPERRRLGVYRLGYAAFRDGSTPPAEPDWKIVFDVMPPNEAVKLVYAPGSHSGAKGETIFNYIVTNTVKEQVFVEGFFDTSALAAGNYSVKIFAADIFGNVSERVIPIEVIK